MAHMMGERGGLSRSRRAAFSQTAGQDPLPELTQTQSQELPRHSASLSLSEFSVSVSTGQADGKRTQQSDSQQSSDDGHPSTSSSSKRSCMDSRSRRTASTDSSLGIMSSLSLSLSSRGSYSVLWRWSGDGSDSRSEQDRSDSLEGLCPPLPGQVPVEPIETLNGRTAQGAMEASPVNKISTEKPTECRKGIRSFLQRLWKAVKSPFCCCFLSSAVDAESFKSLYNVGDVIGSGGFGSVYKGTRKFDGKKVAIKQISKIDNNRYLYITDSMAKRVAVIGAGSSGLSSIKCCLDEGLEPVCFESSDDIGGLWRFKVSQTLPLVNKQIAPPQTPNIDKPEAEHSSIYRSLTVNTSKEMMCYSDFPVPDHYPNFMHNTLIVQYYKLYAEHFNLLKHIHFQTTVRSVRQRPDFSDSGQWEVVTVDRDGQEEKHVFDGVLVCSGLYTQPIKPVSDFPGIDTFPGTIIHSWEYKDPDPYFGKRVVIVGIGNSGADIAVELSRVCEKTFLSTRKGAWVIGRMVGKGLPLDMTMVRRVRDLIYCLLPRSLLNWIGETSLNQRYDHKLYGLQPIHRILDQRAIINDDLPGRILVGELVMKPNMQKFQGSTLVFDDGTVEEKIDAVILCTGYDYTFPFLPASLKSGADGDLKLYKRIFPPSLERPTLAIIGLLQTRGPIMPAVELQARWATRVIAGLNRLPPADKMEKIIEKDIKAHLKCYPCPKLAALQVDYIPYLDTIANEVGVCPNIAWLLLRDPAVGLRVFFGPCTPYQFRLSGPGHWRGARKAILTQWERVAKPMKTRPIPEPSSSRLFVWLGLSGGAAVIFAVIAMRNKIPLCF